MTEPKRINVAVSPDTVTALRCVMDREGVDLAEATRRLIGYGDFVYRAVKVDGGTVLVRTADRVREVEVL